MGRKWKSLLFLGAQARTKKRAGAGELESETPAGTSLDPALLLQTGPQWATRSWAGWKGPGLLGENSPFTFTVEVWVIVLGLSCLQAALLQSLWALGQGDGQGGSWAMFLAGGK